MATLYKTIYPSKYFRDYLAQEVRPDGREFTNFRPVSVNASSITKADSSAIFKIGNTTVICGIKAELAPPKSDTPDSGYIVANVGLSPLCSPKFRPGPPSDQAQVYTKIIDDILKNSKAINFQNLCICKNKLVWALYCDLECINFDGSILDACIGALFTALSTLTLPQVEYNPQVQTTVIDSSRRHPIHLRCLLTCTTFTVFQDDVLLVDPTDEEESQALSRFTIIMDKEEIYNIYKPGGVPISTQVLLTAIVRAKNRSETLNSLINSVISNK